MSRRLNSTKSKKRSYEDKFQKEIELIRKNHCSHCEEPAVGPDRCDKCQYGNQLNDLYWSGQMVTLDYGD